MIVSRRDVILIYLSIMDRMNIDIPVKLVCFLGKHLPEKQMSRICLGNSYFIKGLDGPIVVADNFVPRFWATIWSDVLNADLADATQMSNLAAVDKLYVSVENQPGIAKLDSIIAAMDFDALEGVLGGFLTQLRNESKIAAIDRDAIWQPVLKFIDDVMSHLSPTSDTCPKSPESMRRRQRTRVPGANAHCSVIGTGPSTL